MKELLAGSETGGCAWRVEMESLKGGLEGKVDEEARGWRRKVWRVGWRVRWMKRLEGGARIRRADTPTATGPALPPPAGTAPGAAPAPPRAPAPVAAPNGGFEKGRQCGQASRG